MYNINSTSWIKNIFKIDLKLIKLILIIRHLLEMSPESTSHHILINRTGDSSKLISIYKYIRSPVMTLFSSNSPTVITSKTYIPMMIYLNPQKKIAMIMSCTAVSFRLKRKEIRWLFLQVLADF